MSCNFLGMTGDSDLAQSASSTKTFLPGLTSCKERAPFDQSKPEEMGLGPLGTSGPRAAAPSSLAGVRLFLPTRGIFPSPDGKKNLFQTKF
ncbi:hypothetical protein PGB90_000473 [Kerria lacca]